MNVMEVTASLAHSSSHVCLLNAVDNQASGDSGVTKWSETNTQEGRYATNLNVYPVLLE